MVNVVDDSPSSNSMDNDDFDCESGKNTPEDYVPNGRFVPNVNFARLQQQQQQASAQLQLQPKDLSVMPPNMMQSGQAMSDDGNPMSPNGNGNPHDPDKRMRREIANSNERRRMQSINAGFQGLRALLPKREGDKISKASILQQTVDFIRMLLDEKCRLMAENQEYRQLLGRGSTSATQTTMSQSSPSSSSPTSQQLSPHSSTSSSPKSSVPSTSGRADSMQPPKKRKRYLHHESTDISDDNGSSTGIPPVKKEPPPPAVPQQSVINSGLLMPAVSSHHPSSSTTSTMTPVMPTVVPPVKPTPTIQSNIKNSITAAAEFDILQRQMLDMRMALDKEQQLRLIVEDQLRSQQLQRQMQQQQNASRLPQVSTAALLELQALQQHAQPATSMASPLSGIAHPTAVYQKQLDALLLAQHQQQLQQQQQQQLAQLQQQQQQQQPDSLEAQGKQSLEVIVAAIRHLEGDAALGSQAGRHAAAAALLQHAEQYKQLKI